MSFKFKLIRKCFQDARNVDPEDADFLLEENDWNDFGYMTTYCLHITPKLLNFSTEDSYTRPLFMGYINIMRLGQLVSDSYLLRDEFESRIFNKLPDNFFSMCFSFDFWNAVENYVSPESRELFVKSLNLILSDEDEMYLKIKNEPCFTTSFLRGNDMNSPVLIRAQEVVTSETRRYDLTQKSLIFSLPDDVGSFEISLSSNINSLPESLRKQFRLVAFIGRNGVGKSTIMYRLVRILYSGKIVREKYKADLGKVNPIDIGFSKLLMISYSYFDNFILPGYDLTEFKTILSGIQNRNGRFLFCGIRDVEKEFEDLIKEYENRAEKEEIEENNDIKNDKFDKDHLDIYSLKSLEQLSEEFETYYKEFRFDETKVERWNRYMELLSSHNNSFSEFILDQDKIYSIGKNFAYHFRRKSTGVKYILHSLAFLISNIKDNSLIIFDEPENHLQPPLVSLLLRIIKNEAEFSGSLVFVSTHSPVVIQEVFADNVIIVDRFGEEFIFRHPRTETFGESIGIIINEVFGLTARISRYYQFADNLLEEVPNNEKESPLEFIRDNFGIELGSELNAYILGKDNVESKEA